MVLSLAILALMALVIWRMGLMPGGGPGNGSRLVSVNLTQGEEKAARKTVARTRQASAARVAPPVPQPVPSPEPTRPPFKLIELSHDDLAASELSGLPRYKAVSGDAGAQSGDSKAAYGPGEGPGGARLYNAEWVREPTDAEIAPYMPRREAGGEWAMIACKTAEHNRVEDCQELGEAVPGGGLARGLRQAAWQFLVRPPRIEGKPMIGAWVRIRFDFTRGVH